MGNLIVVNDKQLETKEYRGQRVVTPWDIAEVHGREVKTINQSFNRNIDKLIEGKDYFILNREEFSRSISVTALSKFSNNKEILVFTESGYLMLNKTFSDDLSWTIQRTLIDNYFRTKSLKIPTTMKEVLLIALDLENENQELKRTIEIQTQLIEENRPKLEYMDMILGSEDTMAISQIAADYDMSGKALNKILHEQGFIRNVNKQWILYKEHMDKGYTKSDTFPVQKKDGSEKIVANTKYTQKGRLKIHEILTQLGIKANFDKEK